MSGYAKHPCACGKLIKVRNKTCRRCAHRRAEAVRDCAVCLMRVGFGYRSILRMLRPLAKKTSLHRWKAQIGIPRSRRTTRARFVGYVRKPKPIKTPKVKPPKPMVSDEDRKRIAREYYAKHAKRINARYHERTLNDPKFKLKRCLRQRIWKVIKQQEGVKRRRSFDLTGCTPQFLKQWLESQFKRGMKWSNYGKRWDIDHKVPCKVFNLSVESEQLKCFHYSNLQPLWKEENLRKHGNVIPTQPELIIALR